MSVALGVIFDLYIDDHKKTVTSESKKEEKVDPDRIQRALSQRLDAEVRARLRICLRRGTQSPTRSSRTSSTTSRPVQEISIKTTLSMLMTCWP